LLLVTSGSRTRIALPFFSNTRVRDIPLLVLSRGASVPKCSVVAIEMLRIAVQFLSLDPTNSRLLPQRKPSFYGLGGYEDGFLDSSLSDFHAPT